MKRGGSLKRSALKRSSMKRAAPKRRASFRAITPARTQRCVRCGGRATTWHHWTPVQALRQVTTDQAVLVKLLADERNLSSFCHRCHQAGEFSPSERFTRAEVPAGAWEFAAELGDRYTARLERLP